MADEITVDRDYVDNFSVKEFAVNQLMPKYFPDQAPSNLTSGMMGMMTEYLSNITEDSFNTASSLVGEAFPTRAKMESSIYSNAALFQLSNIFAEAGTCDFIIGIPESDIQNNFIEKEGSDYKFFYIDKNTVIMVGDIPFTFDYDIEIRGVYREIRKGYVYSAKYMITDREYTNSVSLIKDPYIKLYKTPTGLIVLQVTLRQYMREQSIYEQIVDNATLNYASVSFNYSGKLLGFDVLYKASGDTDYNTQLATKVIYSLPSKSPFCYYKKAEADTIELSFTTNGAYFQPDFNSEVEIIPYTTLGEAGNFPEYVGNEVVIQKGEAYDYPSSWIMTAKPISGCVGGKNPMSMDGLRQLTVEGFSTANCLSTEHDLQVYYDNYEYRYNNKVLFIKKRNDAVELLFSAFMYMKKGDYMYPTNTLTLDSNIMNLDLKDGGQYVLDPGFLFGYKDDECYDLPVYFIIVDGDGAKYDVNGRYIDKDGEYDPSLDITMEELQRKIDGRYVEETDHSYYRFVGDKYYLYYSDGNLVPDADPLTVSEVYTMYANGELSYAPKEGDSRVVDFLFDYEKDAQARKDYLDYYENYKLINSKPDLTLNEYLIDYSFKDYKTKNGIDTRRTIYNTNVEDFPEKQQFMFTNPFILTVSKDTGLITYYQSFISQDSAMDFVNENDEDSFMQFVSYTFHIERDISSEKKYHIRMAFLPSATLNEEGAKFVNVMYDENNPSLFTLHEGAKPSLSNFNKSLLLQNRFRVVLTFTDGGLDIGYMELIPTGENETGQITMEGEFYTDDYITTSNRFRVVHKCPHCGAMILNSANKHVENFDYYCDKCGKTFKEGIINIRESDSLLVPITGENIRITTLFRDPEKDMDDITDNGFIIYDQTYRQYVWTNVYETLSEPVTFIKPLNMMRSIISYKDYYIDGIDPLDCTISEIPLLKYSVLAYKDESMEVTDPLLSDDIGKFNYFMDSFLESYSVLTEAKQKMNGMNIDVKFYNTYGRSTNFTIGNDGEILDTNNIYIGFGVWLADGTDMIAADSELKLFIKDYIEQVNDSGSNNLYVSNLIHAIKERFAYVKYLTFMGINGYDLKYQNIINTAINLEELSKEERRKFVPDLLVININNIQLKYFS